MKTTLVRVAAVIAAGAVLLTPPPAQAGPPFRTDDPEPVDPGHWEIYGFSTATKAGNDTGGVLAGLEVNYGAAVNLQLHMIVPLAFDSPEGSGAEVGAGDLELGAKYRFVDEDEHGWRPQIGVFPLIEVPTGNAHRGLGGGSTQMFLPVWLQKSFGAWTTYGGGGYWVNPGAGNRNYWFAGWLVQRKVSKQLTLGGEVFRQSADTDTGSASSGYNIGGIYDVDDHHHVLFSAGRGVEGAQEDNQFSYYLGYQYTF